jgi:hypothetical protein
LTNIARPDFHEEFQRKISSARLCSLSVDFIKDADDYANQGEKLLQRVLVTRLNFEIKLKLKLLNRHVILKLLDVCR